MRDVMRYSGIVTKVAAMRAKLLKPQDYEQLASMNTVTDIIEYLKQDFIVSQICSKKIF